jgi:hypothetical protein
VNHNKDPAAYQLKNLKGFQVSHFTTQSQVLDNFMFLLQGGCLAVPSLGVRKLGFHKFMEKGSKGCRVGFFFSLQIFIFLSWKI